MEELPQMHFGLVSEKPINWREIDDKEDENISQEDVVAMIGFDPFEEDENVAE